MEFILRSLYDLKIQSVIIEGGAKTIKNFLDSDTWDSIRIFKSNENLKDGPIQKKACRPLSKNATRPGRVSKLALERGPTAR